MRLRALRDACLGGFLYGALLYGAVLSLVHVVHNHLGSARDALITSPASSCSTASGARRSSRWRPGGDSFSRPESQGRRGLLLGLFAFNLFFWEVFFLYGLTYDQAPFASAPAAWGMAGVLALLASPSPWRAALGSWAPVPALRGAPARRGGWAGRPRRLFAVGFAAHAAAPLYAGRGAGGEAGGSRSAAADRGRGHRAQGGRRRARRRRLAGRQADDGRGASSPPSPAWSTAGRPVRWSRSTDSNSAVIWASIYTGDAARAARRPRLLPRSRCPAWRRRGSSRSTAPSSRSWPTWCRRWASPSLIAVDRFSLAAPPLWEIADRARAARSASWTATSTPSRRCALAARELVPLLRPRRDARPARRREVALFAQPSVALPGAAGRCSPAATSTGSPAALLKLLAERPQPRLRQLLHPPAGQRPALVLEVVRARPSSSASRRRTCTENGGIIPGVYRDFDALPRPPPRRGRAGHGRDRRLRPRPQPDDRPRPLHPAPARPAGHPADAGRPGEARARAPGSRASSTSIPRSSISSGCRCPGTPPARSCSTRSTRASSACTRCARCRPTAASAFPPGCPGRSATAR